MKIGLHPQLLEAVWYRGSSFGTSHNIVWIIHIHLINYLFYFICNYRHVSWITFQDIKTSAKNRIVYDSIFYVLCETMTNNKSINKSGMLIPRNQSKLFPNIFYPYICHLISWIEKLDNQYRHNSQWCYKWHNLTVWNISLNFYVSYHQTSLMLKHRYYYFSSF